MSEGRQTGEELKGGEGRLRDEKEEGKLVKVVITVSEGGGGSEYNEGHERGMEIRENQYRDPYDPPRFDSPRRGYHGRS